MQYHEVASRLEKRIGLGEFPLIRAGCTTGCNGCVSSAATVC